LLVVPVTLSVLSERSSRLVDLTLTAPLSRTEYYGGKFFAALALGGVYLAATLPFTAMFVWFAGPKWLVPAGAHLLLGSFVVVFVCCAGMFFSVLFNGRALVAAVVSMVVLGAASLAWPVIGGAAYGRGTPDALGLRALLLSPSFVASNMSSFLRQAESPTPLRLLLVGAVLAVVFVVAGWWAFTRLQDAEGWQASRRRLSTFAVVAAITIVTICLSGPAVIFGARSPSFYYDAPPDEVTGVSYSLSFLTDERFVVGGTYSSPVLVTFDVPRDATVLRSARLHLESPDMRFEPAAILLGDLDLNSPTIQLRPDVVVRVDSASAAFGGTTRVLHRLEADAFDASGVTVVGVRPRVDAAFLAPLAATAALAGIVLIVPRLGRRPTW
ncbi:MAG: hypothetical protein WDA16_13635, partial [Candidatus Thermoplasmatota archaeon]